MKINYSDVDLISSCTVASRVRAYVLVGLELQATYTGLEEDPDPLESHLDIQLDFSE